MNTGLVETSTNLGDIVQQLAAPRLPGFSYVGREDPERHRLWAADGREICFSVEWNAKGRLSISGHYPESPHNVGSIGYHERTPHITVDKTRSPDAIAKEIGRRFLPQYTAVYRATLEAVRKRDALNVETGERALDLARAFGRLAPDGVRGDNGSKREGTEHIYLYLRGSDDFSGDVEITGYNQGDQRVTMKLRLTFATALAVARALEGQRP